MFSSIEEIIKEIAQGNMIVVVDDESRENEGDLIFSAQHVTPEKINFMAKYGRGLICVPMSEQRSKKFDLPLMAKQNGDNFNTAFTVSVDASKDITTGISAHDRSHTIKILSDKKSKKEDITSPGHIFPLLAKKGGVLIRAGHTEASVDLMEMAGVEPVGVICEIMNEDGSMARVPDLLKFCKKHDLKICSIAKIIEYKRKKEKLVEKTASTILPTKHGKFKLLVYESILDKKQHLALILGEPSMHDNVLVRVHSECLTGDVFGSKRCDCGYQLDKSLEMIQKEGTGILLYMRQEGRGIGLGNKIKCYHLQDNGYDTVEANEKLGFKADLREYGIGAQMLADIGVHTIRLITNNPRKIIGLGGYGININGRIPILGGKNKYNENYLNTKKEKLGHLL